MPVRLRGKAKHVREARGVPAGLRLVVCPNRKTVSIPVSPNVSFARSVTVSIRQSPTLGALGVFAAA